MSNEQQSPAQRRTARFVGLVATNLLAWQVLVVLIGLVSLGASVPLRPWTGPVAALLAGMPPGSAPASSNPASIMVAVSLALPPCAVLLSFAVLYLSGRIGYPARLAPAAALLYIAFASARVAERFPIVSTLPRVSELPQRWAHGGLLLVALSALATVPAVVLLTWLVTGDVRRAAETEPAAASLTLPAAELPPEPAAPCPTGPLAPSSSPSSTPETPVPGADSTT